MRVGIFSDSINIPPKEGINVHTYDVACALAERGESVLLIVCDRGWLDLSILSRQSFDTLVLSPAEFYDTDHIEQIIITHRLDILQTYMTYFSATVLGIASLRTKIPMCIEFHDIETTVGEIYGLSLKERAYHAGLQRRAGQLASMIRIMSSADYGSLCRQWPELVPYMKCLPVSVIPKKIFGPRTNHRRNVLFIGNTSYPPNEKAANRIVDEVAPECPDIVFTLVGRGTERWGGRNIKAKGMVPAITDELQGAAIGLAPLTEGSGMKIKLLDYLSAGLPIITTSIGAAGYPQSDAIIIEDDFDLWPELLRSILNHPRIYHHRVMSALKLFDTYFNLNNTVKELRRAYRQLRFNPYVKSLDTLSHIEPTQTDIYWLREVRETPRQPITGPMLFQGAGK